MRVLIVRLRAIGDVIHALPVACALKDQVPGVFVGWLAEAWASKVIRAHDAIDQHITVAPGWARSFRQVLRLRRELRALRFDVVLDLQGVRSSVFAALLSGAPRRLGFAGMIGHEFRQLISSTDRIHSISQGIARRLHFGLVWARSEHIVDRYLEILTPLCGRAGVPRFDIPESDDDAEVVRSFLRSVGLQEREFAVINPGGPVWRRWPAERFAAVADHLASSHRLPTVVLPGLRDEMQAAQQVVALAETRAVLAPQLPLSQLGALARRSQVFLSGDTGPLHLAAAVGAKCIGLIGHEFAERLRPYGLGNIVVRGKPVPFHLLRHGGLGEDAMKAINVDEVCRACDEALAGRPAPTSAALRQDSNSSDRSVGRRSGRTINTYITAT
jgi:heptosyltransferase I